MYWNIQKQDGVTTKKRYYPLSPAECKIHTVEKLQSTTVTSNGDFEHKKCKHIDVNISKMIKNKKLKLFFI